MPGGLGMRPVILFAISALILATLACAAVTSNSSDPIPTVPTLEISVFDSGRTAYGFFPTPPEVSVESVVNNMKTVGEHADVVLFKQVD